MKPGTLCKVIAGTQSARIVRDFNQYSFGTEATLEYGTIVEVLGLLKEDPYLTFVWVPARNIYVSFLESFLEKL